MLPKVARVKILLSYPRFMQPVKYCLEDYFLLKY